MGRSKDLADLGSSATRLDTIGASSGALSNKNVVINGAMNVAQRATSATGVGASTGYFTCDRWKYYTSATAGRVTLTQDSSGPSGFANSFKIATTTADTSIAASEQVMIQQRIEGQNLQHFKKGTSDALPWTLSFYVKGNASATYVAELMDSDNSDRHVNKQFTVGTDWSRVVIEFPADTTGVLDDDSNVSIDLQIILHSGSTFTSGTLQETWGALNQANRAVGISSILDSTDRTFFITGVQLEAGSVTDFEHEPVGVTLNKCRRYYNQVLKGAWGVASAAGSPVFHFFNTVEMRAAPSFSLTVNKVAMGDMISTGFNLTGASISAGTHNTSQVSVWTFTASSFSSTMTDYRPLLLESISGGSFNGEVQISAEL